MGIAAGIGAAGSALSGIFGSSAAASAGQQQADASIYAANLANQRYNQTRNDLAPYRSAGASAANQLTTDLPSLTAAFNPTESQLSQTPGYQFDLSQGLKSTQNAAAARGLGLSGAALKGASTYATGLADNTLMSQFSIDQQNKQNSFNKLLGAASLGENAGAQTGSIGASTAATAGNAAMTGAQGTSAATIAGSQAFNPLLSSLGSDYMMYNPQGLYSATAGLYGARNGLTSSDFG